MNISPAISSSLIRHFPQSPVGGKKKPTKDLVDMDLPSTVGMWDAPTPVELDLAIGKNVLTSSGEHEALNRIRIRDVTLTPVE